MISNKIFSRNKKSFFLFFILIITVISFLGLSLKHDPRALPSVLIGRSLPEFDLPDLADLQKKHNEEELKGRWIVLNVWSSWCVECRQENSILFALKKKYKDFVWVGVNYKDRLSDALLYLKELGNPYAYSIQDQKGDWSINLGVYGVPEAFLIDPEGIVRWRWLGGINEQVFSQKISQIVGQKEVGVQK